MENKMENTPDGSTPVELKPVSEFVDRTEEIKPDIYNPYTEEDLRLSQDVLDEAMATEALTTVPAGKPNDQEFIRVHPDDSYHWKAALITHHQERGARYLILPKILPFVSKCNIKFHYEQLFLYVTRQGKVAFWPIKIPKDNSENSWLSSAYGAVEMAQGEWVCVTSVPKRSMYVASPAQGIFPEPDWPKILQGKSIFDLLRLCFGDKRLINVEDHPLIQELRGAA
jgi:hypothetical protein